MRSTRCTASSGTGCLIERRGPELRAARNRERGPAMRPVFSALILSAALVPCAAAAEFRRFEDAPLHAVQFWDKNEGWAAGDEGIVWHTIDGGQSWERQPTGVRASLRGMHFLNPYVGWIVGREELPGGGSTGT